MESGDGGLGGEERRRGWWDKECKEEEKVRRELRKWKRGVGDGSKYRELRGTYKELLEVKKERKRTGGRRK